jgi:phage terminase large subunit-like protein
MKKLTFDPKTGKIVNVSGGGCPDVPFLAQSLIGKTLNEAQKVMEEGYSLCAYMLNKAVYKALELMEKK